MVRFDQSKGFRFASHEMLSNRDATADAPHSALEFLDEGVRLTTVEPKAGDLTLMKNQESDGIAAFLTRSVRGGADSGQIAESVAATCRAFDNALTPIIGQRGVAALYKRSLHVTGLTHAWLAGAQEGAPHSMDVATLTSRLAQQTSADAAAGGALLLQTFYDLLTTLVGPSLTEQLLRSVWATFLSGPSAQDTTP